jgi:hypothetical protein
MLYLIKNNLVFTAKLISKKKEVELKVMGIQQV